MPMMVLAHCRPRRRAVRREKNRPLRIKPPAVRGAWGRTQRELSRLPPAVDTYLSAVIAGHSASEDARERAYDPAIHLLRENVLAKKDGPLEIGSTRFRAL